MPSALSAPYVAIALGESAQPLSIAVVVDSSAAAPVVLRELLDGRVLLGCITDSAGRVLQFLEIWVQQASMLAAAAHVAGDLLQNGQLDEKWKAMAESWAGGDGAIVTGWETKSLQPFQLDLKAKRAKPLTSATGKELTLCRDASALSAAGLPPYATTLHRYLTDGELFYPVTPEAPAPEKKLLGTLPVDPKAPLINPEGAIVLVRGLQPFSLGAYSDFLGGCAAELSIGAAAGQKPWLASLLDSKGKPAWLLGSFGRSGRVLEVLYLKLCLLLDAFREVRSATESLKRPFLSLSTDSFRVSSYSACEALPSQWTAKVSLTAQSEAIKLTVPGVETATYIAARPHPDGSHRAPVMRRDVTGTALLRVRRVLNEKPGRYILEGTLVANGIRRPAKSDLVWLRLSIGGSTFDLWGHAEGSDTGGNNELRFRSLEQTATNDQIATLKRGEGWSAADVAFSITAGLSSACDMYAMAAVAAQMLLANADRTLPIIVDELLSLAAIPRQKNESAPPPLQSVINQLFRENSGMQDNMGPHQVMHAPNAYAANARIIPADLWSRILTFIVRCFPGSCNESFVNDATDRPTAMHTMFDAPITELSSLKQEVSKLIFVDSRCAGEISVQLLRRARHAEQLLATSSGSLPQHNPASKFTPALDNDAEDSVFIDDSSPADETIQGGKFA